MLRRHLTYANIMSTLAVVLLLSTGTAVALAGSNTVFSDDIVDGAVTSADIRNGGVQRADVHPGAWHVVTDVSYIGDDVCPNGVTGHFCGEGPGAHPLANFWQNWGNGFETARYALDATGTVLIEGLVQYGGSGYLSTGPGTSSTVFILPQGYRPAQNLVFPVECGHFISQAGQQQTAPGRVTVFGNGRVEWFGSTDCDPGDHLSLSGISFLAEQ